MQKLFGHIRDPFRFLLMLIHFTLLLFLLYHSVEVLEQIQEEADATKTYDNQVMAQLSLAMDHDMDSDEEKKSESEEEAIVERLLQALKGAAASHSKLLLCVPVGEGTNTFETTFLFGDEEMLASLQEDESRRRTEGLFVGEQICEMANLRDGRQWLRFAGEFYPITAVYRNTVSGGYDNRVTVFWDTLSDASQRSVKTQLAEFLSQEMAVYIELDSDQAIASAYQELSLQLQAQGFLCEVTDSRSNVNYQSWFYQMLSKAAMLCVGGFAGINGIVVSWIFVMRRREEFAVRKAFGYRSFSLFLLVFKELAACLLCAIPIVGIGEVWYSYVSGTAVVMRLHSLKAYLVLIASLAALTLIASLIPMYHVYRISPMEGMEGV